MDILKIVNQQNTFFNSNTTKEVNFRIETLQKLKYLLKENEDKLYTAIYSDFKKSEFETYLTEISLHHLGLRNLLFLLCLMKRKYQQVLVVCRKTY